MLTALKTFRAFQPFTTPTGEIGGRFVAIQQATPTLAILEIALSIWVFTFALRTECRRHLSISDIVQAYTPRTVDNPP